MDKLVVLSDLQISYHDVASLNAVQGFLEDFQPQTLVLNGDIVDFTGLSKYRLTLEERTSVAQQLATLEWYLARWRRALPTSRIVYIMGNHEERLATYITEHAPELDFLESEGALNFATLAKLGEYGVELVEPYGAGIEWPDGQRHKLFITHGQLVRVHTAAANLELEGSSGISGHTHRLSSYYRTDRSGAHAWYEGGSLCDPKRCPPARPGVRNWQQGFVVGYAELGMPVGYADQDIWNVYQVSITNHSFIWDGKLYAP